MDEPIRSIFQAVAQGRGRRGWKDPAVWVRLRAQLLTFLFAGRPLATLAGVRDLPGDERTRLIGEACDAVLRGGLPSLEADAACRDTWRRWCRLGDVAACKRLQRSSPESAQRVR